MTTTDPPLADRLTIILDGMRAAMAAQRKGPARALLAAILRLLEGIVALLAEFHAGTLPAGLRRGAAPAAAQLRVAEAAAAGDHAGYECGLVSVERAGDGIRFPYARNRSVGCKRQPITPRHSWLGTHGGSFSRSRGTIPSIPHGARGTRPACGAALTGESHPACDPHPVGLRPPKRIGYGRARGPPKKSGSRGGRGWCVHFVPYQQRIYTPGRTQNPIPRSRR
jgi:hypothetical protein